MQHNCRRTGPAIGKRITALLDPPSNRLVENEEHTGTSSSSGLPKGSFSFFLEGAVKIQDVVAWYLPPSRRCLPTSVVGMFLEPSPMA